MQQNLIANFLITKYDKNHPSQIKTTTTNENYRKWGFFLTFSNLNKKKRNLYAIKIRIFHIC